MPKVPISNVVPMTQQGEQPSETMYAMAAALMHQEGRLFDQKPKPKDKDGSGS